MNNIIIESKRLCTLKYENITLTLQLENKTNSLTYNVSEQYLIRHYALKCLNIDQHLLLTKQTRQKLQQSA